MLRSPGVVGCTTVPCTAVARADRYNGDHRQGQPRLRKRAWFATVAVFGN